MKIWLVSVLFLLFCGPILSSAPTNPGVNAQLVESLKKKLADGQVSVEPGPGEGSSTLAEQIQFLEGELLKQNKPIEAPQQQVLQPVLPLPTTLVPPAQPIQTQPPSIPQPMMSQSHVAHQELEALRVRVAGLEARMAILEQQRSPSLAPQGAPYGGQ